MDCTKPYVLKYYLGDDSASDIDSWAKDNGYVVYELLNKNQPQLYSAGPGEFISLIRNADLVCSDSFHCIAFAIIFRKPFLVFERKGSEDYMASRLDTLLKKFDLQNRWERLVQKEDYLNCDYVGVDDILKEEQQRFLDYISEVLRDKQ